MFILCSQPIRHQQQQQQQQRGFSIDLHQTSCMHINENDSEWQHTNVDTKYYLLPSMGRRCEWMWITQELGVALMNLVFFS